MTTQPGFSSRNTSTTVRQFPQRDEIQMSEMTPGWSNSGDAPAATEPDTTPEPAEAEAKVVESPKSESKTVRKSAPRKKA